MKKVFIVCPFGLTLREFEEMKQRALNLLQSQSKNNNESLVITNDFFKTKTLWSLARIHELLACTDIAFLMKGWRNNKDCSNMYLCAVEYRVVIFDEEKGEYNGNIE